MEFNFWRFKSDLMQINELFEKFKSKILTDYLSCFSFIVKKAKSNKT